MFKMEEKKRKGRNIILDPMDIIIQPITRVNYKSMSRDEYEKKIIGLDLSKKQKDKIIEKLRIEFKNKLKHLELED